MMERNTRFAGLAAYYEELHRSMEKGGGALYRFTALGAWATSRPEHIRYFFDSIPLDRYRLFMDLGSGDGLVACIAALYTRSIGVEVDPDLCGIAGRAARQLNLAHLVEFVCADYLTQRVEAADCLYVYPDKPFYALETLLTESGWRGDLLIYGPHFAPRRLEEIKRFELGNERLTLYRPR